MGAFGTVRSVMRPSDGRGASSSMQAGTFGAAEATTAAGPGIRIGVIQQATELHPGAAGAWTLRDQANQMPLLTGSGGAVTVTLAQASATHWRLQVMCGSAAAVATRKAAAEALGHPTLTEVIPACTRLLICEFPPSVGFTVRNDYRLLLIDEGLAPVDPFWRQITVGGGTLYRVVRGTTAISWPSRAPSFSRRRWRSRSSWRGSFGTTGAISSCSSPRPDLDDPAPHAIARREAWTRRWRTLA